ncbi:hypothetical protein B9479_005187 [Cryptococcus floricola]|uniref:Uncharacterized protein n=1 Tax=Cryptococcus floricola TaxID=2591691 RepID=A0A5D3AWE8_9TREE|nr:hypothetical protein B9479_005187 [Cryptococcus floricola]
MSHLPTPPSTTPHSPPASSSSSSSSTSSSASRRRQEREEEAAKHAQEAWSASSSFHSVFGKKGMNLSIGSVSALEGSWRDGAPQAQVSSASIGRGEEAPVILGKEQERKGSGVDETGDDGDCLGRVDLEGSKGISKSMVKDESRELLAIQVLARMMDSSKGRDKVLKMSPPPNTPPPPIRPSLPSTRISAHPSTAFGGSGGGGGG